MTTLAIKITSILGGLILIAGAAFHMTGLDGGRAAIANIDSEFFKKTLPVTWILPSVHWAFIGFLSIGLSFYKSKACAAILIAFGLMILLDAFVSFLTAGPFLGVYIMSAAGIFLLISGLMLRKLAHAA